MARRLVGGHHLYVLPAAMLIGALLLVLADTLGRTLIAPSEIRRGSDGGDRRAVLSLVAGTVQGLMT